MKKAIYALPVLAVVSIVLCVLELPTIGLMWKTERLVWAAAGVWCLFLALIIWIAFRRFGQIKPYATEISLLGLCFLPIALFLALYTNKLGSERAEIPFTFAVERAYYSAPLGMLKTDKAKPTKFKLTLLDEAGETRHFTYTNGPLYPNTQPGETIALPMRKGVFGTWWIEME
jgi:hypothetical protein